MKLSSIFGRFLTQNLFIIFFDLFYLQNFPSFSSFHWLIWLIYHFLLRWRCEHLPGCVGVTWGYRNNLNQPLIHECVQRFTKRTGKLLSTWCCRYWGCLNKMSLRGSEEGSFKRRAFVRLEVWKVVKCFLLSRTRKILNSDWLEDKN